MLLADDEPNILEILSLHLQRSDYEVLVASNGIDALEMAQRLLPCVMVLDELMPGLCGSEVASRLAENLATASIPSILITGYLNSHLPSAHIQRVVRKPFGVDEIVRAILELGIGRNAAAAF
jgi:CheY-like chemotaxis protein